MDTQLTLAQAKTGFLFDRKATGRSKHTIAAYHNTFSKLELYIPGDTPLASISRDRLVAFFAWLKDDYVSEPSGFAPRGQIRLSPKSIKNIRTDLAAFWAWALEEGYVSENIVKPIKLARVNDPVIETFTKEEIEALLKACKNPHWESNQYASSQYTTERDRAIVFVLVDAGIRASELVQMTVDDLNLNTNSIKVKGKGGKERIVQIGRRTAKALWRSLAPRLQQAKPDDPIFVVDWPADPRPFTRRHLTTTLKRVGERAGVKVVYAHKFRHTFAITYLRNGGDLLTLQRLMGHATLEMTRRYAHVADADCIEAHRKASPVDNWRL
ncbi:MAG: tyrosine-type recombinase/integrase [Thermoflexales bacterium]|nr:tyrosine-type recombinase/integrase [Thermoflexales bacterium]